MHARWDTAQPTTRFDRSARLLKNCFALLRFSVTLPLSARLILAGILLLVGLSLAQPARADSHAATARLFPATVEETVQRLLAAHQPNHPLHVIVQLDRHAGDPVRIAQ